MKWKAIFEALRGTQKPPRSFTVGVEWVRGPDDPTAELTEDTIVAEQPDWVPPPDAARDPWRPRTTLPD